MANRGGLNRPKFTGSGSRPLKITASSRRATIFAARRNMVSALVISGSVIWAPRRRTLTCSVASCQMFLSSIAIRAGGGCCAGSKPGYLICSLRTKSVPPGERSDQRQESFRHACAARFLMDHLVDARPLLVGPWQLRVVCCHVSPWVRFEPYRRINQPRPEERALARVSKDGHSETEPAAILRDGGPQVGCSRLAYLMCRSRVNPRSVRLIRMRSAKLSGKYIEPSLPGRGSMTGAPDAFSLCTFALSYAHDVDVRVDPHGVSIHPAQAQALRAVEPRKLPVSSCIGR